MASPIENMSNGASLDERVAYMLMDMHDAGEVSISNGAHGDIVEYQVCRRCIKTGQRDDASIRRFILENPNVKDALPQEPRP